MKAWFQDFFDNISGVLFTPSAALRKIAAERKIAQSLVILILADLLPTLAGFRQTFERNFFESQFPGLESIYPSLEEIMPALTTLTIVIAILLKPLWHFIFTGVVELTCQFLKPGAQGDPGAEPLCPVTTGVGLFSSMASATLPFIFMVPVNLLSTLTGINFGFLFRFIFWVWVVALQVIAVRETHGFTTGRAALAYFALPLLGIAFGLVMIILLLTAASPYIPNML